MAAAVVIFAAGMSVSAFRASGEQTARAVDSSTSQTASAVAERRVDDLSVTRAEFARIDARLRAVESADAYRASYTPPAAGPDNDDVSARLSSLENYVLNRQIENSETLGKFTQALNANRRDIDDIRETAQKFDLLDKEVQDHRQVLLMRTALSTSAR